MTVQDITTASHHPKELRRVFGAFPSGVTAVAALVDGVPVGLAASSFTSVSLSPALVSVCADVSSTTWPILRTRPRLGISVLGAHQEQACRQLSSKNGERFATLDYRASADGAVFVEGASAWLECQIDSVLPAGDHDIVVFQVLDLDADATVPPLVFHASKFQRLAA
ncbi:flavin reductase family protein [Catenulispora sp. NF23]|uniref:Flavin reductase family protein n=1 Tax=Catenulispora pinistramenti TaxID=2705254 RepID=A0ABS5L3J5_9ACTN|nr:flavin reductase family protein [Catenulispora pinistramenti]MBS2537360.1 flavin reductase family protein [Catenulispora pinistramenti]MBS2552892.1 flavin reductase family protein [Catenulispora pinistramenti]